VAIVVSINGEPESAKMYFGNNCWLSVLKNINDGEKADKTSEQKNSNFYTN
jgi:hypothetical protein